MTTADVQLKYFYMLNSSGVTDNRTRRYTSCCTNDQIPVSSLVIPLGSSGVFEPRRRWPALLQRPLLRRLKMLRQVTKAPAPDQALNSI